MALPTSGPLSFSMIAGELSSGTPYSLHTMSSAAGFGTPDNVSDFYGYSNCPANGTFLYSSCNGCELIYHYADGSCGQYSQVVEYNSASCGCGGGLTLFFRTNESNDPFKNCDQPCTTPAWHNGVGPLPNVDDFVYDDAGGNQPLMTYVGGYFGMTVNEFDPAYDWFQITKTPGLIVDLNTCFM